MKKEKINLPTKITISRIIIAILLILAIFITYFLDLYKVIDVSKYNIVLFENNLITINLINILFLVVFLFASLTDFLDGYIARKYNMVSDLGKFLDPLADKMLINAIMVFYSLNFVSLTNLNDINNGRLVTLTFPFFCVIIMIIRDLIVDSLRFMAASKNKVIAANIYGKIKTVSQMFAISLIMLNGLPFSLFDYSFIPYLHISEIFCYLATFFSVLSGVIYLKDNIHVLFEE